MNCLPFVLFIESLICHIYLQNPFMININSFPGGSDGKDSACNVGNQSLIPGLGRSLEEEMATHSGIIAWKIPWMVEPGRLQSKGSQRVGHH